MANEWDEAPEQMDQALEDAPLDEGLDASWLAGMSEYSATGGGLQPLHVPQLRRYVMDEADRPSAGDSVAEMYRQSLAQMTQDGEHLDAVESWDEGPLHVELLREQRGFKKR